jgi:hypothetical protein
LSAALEDLSDEGVLLRRKAGLPPDAALDTAGVKLQRDITIAQLRSVNALLERQVRVGVLVLRWRIGRCRRDCKLNQLTGHLNNTHTHRCQTWRRSGASCAWRSSSEPSTTARWAGGLWGVALAYTLEDSSGVGA